MGSSWACLPGSEQSEEGVEVIELGILTSEKAIINGEKNPPKEHL